MNDTNGRYVSFGDSVVTLCDDGVVLPGSVGRVVDIRPKTKGWGRSRKYPEHCRVASRDYPESGWSGWYDPDEIALIASTQPDKPTGEEVRK